MIEKLKRLLRKLTSDIKDSQSKSAQKTMLEELFNDWYVRRRDVYKMNFFRGIFFGLGSVLGGTLIVAIVIFIVSLFTELPLVGQFFEQTKNTLDTSTE